jgi:hypothetical protein
VSEPGIFWFSFIFSSLPPSRCGSREMAILKRPLKESNMKLKTHYQHTLSKWITYFTYFCLLISEIKTNHRLKQLVGLTSELCVHVCMHVCTFLLDFFVGKILQPFACDRLKMIKMKRPKISKRRLVVSRYTWRKRQSQSKQIFSHK